MARAEAALAHLGGVTTAVDARRGAITAREPLSLRRAVLWTTVGNGVYASVQWLQVAVVAHLGTSKDVGLYALAMSTCAPIFMLSSLQLRQIQATDSTRQHSFPEYLGLRLFSSALALIAVSSVAVVFSKSQLAFWLTILVGLFKAAESVSDIYQGLLQQHERMDYVARSLLFKSGFALLAFGGIYVLTHNLAWSVAAMIASQIANILLYDVPVSYSTTTGGREDASLDVLRSMCRINLRGAISKRLAVRALPLGIAMMLISLYGNLPRFVLNRYLGSSGVGLFAAITYLPMIGSLIITAAGTSVAARLSRYGHTDRPAYYQLLGKLVLFGMVIGVAGIFASLLFGKDLLRVLYGPEYARSAHVLVLAMIAGALSNVVSCLGFGATALGRLKAQPWIVGFSAFVLLGAASRLVPLDGLAGAASATVISAFACLCGYTGLVFWNRQ